MSDFASIVQEWIDQEESIREGLAHEGPQLIRRLLDRGGFGATSLRQVAREASMSPTYLSLVETGKAIISPRAFVKLASLAAVGEG